MFHHHRQPYDQRMYFPHPSNGFYRSLPIPYNDYHGSMNRFHHSLNFGSNFGNSRPQELIRNNGGFSVRIEDEIAIVDVVVGGSRRLETPVLDEYVGGRQRINNLDPGFSFVDGIMMLNELVLIDGGSGHNRELDKKLSAEAIWQHLTSRIHQTVAGQESGFCVVCQSEFLDAEKLGKLDCGHEFHADCIHQWLLQKNSCPICKRTGLTELER